MHPSTELSPSLEIEDQGLVSDTAKRPESQSSAAFVGLCPTTTGYVFCTFQSGPKKNDSSSTILICRSKDQGRTWEELPVRFDSTVNAVPGSYSAGEIVEAEPGRLLLISTWFNRSDPDRPLFDAVTEGILPSKQLLAVSTDDGNTWSPWRELDMHGLKGCACTGPLLKWPDGRIAFPFESYKEFDDPTPGRHAAWLLVSKDKGRTFGRPVLVAQHPQRKIFYWDQRLCVGNRTGEYVAMFWSHDLTEKRDLHVHIKRASIDDLSHETAPIRPTEIVGQICAPLLCDDGRLLAFVVDRGRPATMALWMSVDGGTTWPSRLVVYDHDEQSNLSQGKENIDFVQYWSDMRKWSFGHPAIRRLGDGRVLVAFYAGPPDRMSVHWARLNFFGQNGPDTGTRGTAY